MRRARPTSRRGARETALRIAAATTTRGLMEIWGTGAPDPEVYERARAFARSGDDIPADTYSNPHTLLGARALYRYEVDEARASYVVAADGCRRCRRDRLARDVLVGACTARGASRALRGGGAVRREAAGERRGVRQATDERPLDRGCARHLRRPDRRRPRGVGRHPRARRGGRELVLRGLCALGARVSGAVARRSRCGRRGSRAGPRPAVRRAGRPRPDGDPPTRCRSSGAVR